MISDLQPFEARSGGLVSAAESAIAPHGKGFAGGELQFAATPAIQPVRDVQAYLLTRKPQQVTNGGAVVPTNEITQSDEPVVAPGTPATTPTKRTPPRKDD